MLYPGESKVLYEPVMNHYHFKEHIKGKDLGLFNKVIDYLNSHGAKVILVNDKTVPPRRYKSIDLLVNNRPSKEKDSALYGLEMAEVGLWDEKSWPLASNQKEHERNLRLFSLEIDHCFVFELENTRTLVNVYFNTYKRPKQTGYKRQEATLKDRIMTEEIK